MSQGTRGVTNAVHEWAKGFGFGGGLSLNAVCEELGDRALITSTGQRAATYIDGSVDRRLDFSFVLAAPWSDGIDGMNAEAMTEGEAWLDWVRSRAAEKDYPDLPNGEVLELETDDAPVMVQVLPDTRMAKYQFSAHIVYRTRS